jgi:arachidonate 15-lipoxygenase
VPGFESDSLAAAFDQGRLFTVAYPELEGLQPSSFPAGRKFVTCPRALFALPPADSIGLPMPVAIRCEPGEGRVYTPRDGWAWQMAKTVVQVADSNHHELIAHLSHTHLLVEAFVIATHRQLAPGHPLFQLLTPHFEGTAFINWAAQEFLVAKGNFVDQLLAGTIESSRGVAAGALKSLSFNASILPARLAERGVDGAELRFPYRDDALQLWHALHDWVAAYVGLYYESDGSVAEDRELQAWAREIVSAKGGGLTDFGQSRGGAIQTRDYLVDALTQLIFTASVQHAAVNFPQRNIMSFAPAAPLSAYAPAPRSRRHSEKDWLGQFAPLQMANQQLMILDLLGSVYHGRLGEYGQVHFADSRVLQPLQVLRVRLKEIEGEIRARNARDTEDGLLPYETLLPTAIPQSINI